MEKEMMMPIIGLILITKIMMIITMITVIVIMAIMIMIMLVMKSSTAELIAMTRTIVAIDSPNTGAYCEYVGRILSRLLSEYWRLLLATCVCNTL